MNNARLTAYILFGIGGLMLFGGLAWGNSVRSFVAKAQKATGVVARLVQGGGRDGKGTDTSFALGVRFETADGTPVEFVTAVSTASRTAEGTEVEVLYLPENPKDAKVNSFTYMWLAPVAFILVGAFMVAIGGGLWLLGGAAAKAIPSMMHPMGPS